MRMQPYMVFLADFSKTTDLFWTRIWKFMNEEKFQFLFPDINIRNIK